ncbi:RHS repeat-associated core domain-containing protein [Paenibacillus sp. SI8]|uniref:RHS repeat-associated core domain-containing protein n=1 Tax=unclassified Paenibacillus TaxID=185978 RepID=UPI0034654102
MKKILNLLLLIALSLQIVMPTTALAESTVSMKQDKSVESQGNILTIEWLSQTFNLAESILLNELNKGYSLTDLYNALKMNSKEELDTLLIQINPEVAKSLQQRNYSADRFTEKKTEETLTVPDNMRSVTTNVYGQSKLVENTGVTKIVSDKFDYNQILHSNVTSSVYGSVYGKLRGMQSLSATPTNDFPTTYDDFAVKRLNTKVNEAPYSVGGHENVSLTSGSLSLENVDMALPGRNGLSFSLNRRYNSSDAIYYDKDVFNDLVYKVEYYPKLAARLYFKYYGERVTQGGGASDFYFQPYYYDWMYASFVQYYGEYGYWGYPTRYSPIQDFNNENRHILESAWPKVNPDDPNSAPIFINEDIVFRGVPFIAKAFTTGEVLEFPGSRKPICLETDYYGNCSRYWSAYANKVKSKEVQENRFPIGKGWSWDIPFIETKDNNKRYITLFGGATYELDGLNLKGYPWKDLTLVYDSTVSVNNTSSYYALQSLNGQKQYFSYDGRLLQISDAYNNTIQFEYANVSPYGVVLTKVKDAIQNEINIAYTTTDVTLTQGSRTVKYTKIKDPMGNKELLSQVTDPAGRDTSYVYDIASAPFDIVGYGRMLDNYSALLKQVYHPTKARTEYTYSAFTRNLGLSAKENVYRVSSREDIVTYTGGSVQKSNHVDYSYAGDGGENKKSSFDFTTTVDDRLKQTTYTYNKQYIDENTPDVIYNTEISQQAGTDKRVTKQTFDTNRKLPVPIEVTTTFSTGTATSQPVTMKRTYDDYQNVLTETNPLNITTTHGYDPATHLQLTSIQAVDAGKSSYTELVRNTQGSVTQFTVKENSTAGALKQQVNYGYDQYGNATAITIKDTNRNIIISQEYSPLYGGSFVTKQSTNVTNVDGVFTTLTKQAEYNKQTAAITRLIDGKGRGILYEYDALGRVTKETLPDLHATTIAYDDLNNKVTTTDVTGLQTIQEFNALGQKVKETTGLNFATYGYDAYGRQTWSENALGRRTDNLYDAWNRITQVSSPEQSVNRIAYDDINRTKVTTDAESNQIRETYDLVGQLMKKEQLKPTGDILLGSFTYDYVSHPLTVTDGNNNLTTNQFDVLGRLIAVTDPLNKTTRYTYSLGGNLIETQYADTSKLQRQYDEAGKMIKRTDPSGLVDKYYYDSNGNVSKQVDRKGQAITFEYDPQRDFLLRSISVNETIAYTYDVAGKRLSLKDNTGTTSYEYEASTGLLNKITYPDSRTMQYQYDILGNLSNSTDPFSFTTVYGYDKLNRLSGVGVAQNNWDASYTYKKNGLMDTITSKNGVTSEYHYDGFNLSNLTQKKSNGISLNVFNYGYDNNSNQTSKTENGAAYSFTYDKLNRIRTSSQFDENYTYDQRDNRETLLRNITNMNNASANYEYDDRNRLTKVTMDGGNVVSYRYNGDGLLYERTENGQTIRYYYNGANMVAEGVVLANGTAALKARYIRGNGLVARVEANGNKVYYQHNGHGDVVGITDASGNTLNTYSYDLWGNPVTSQETVAQPFRYSGEYYDNTTGLQYLRARWYDPSVGRFINEDTYEGQIDNPLSLNLYTYVSNNPLTHVDPSGHMMRGDIVATNIDNARSYGSNSDVYWQVRSRLGSEALGAIPGAKSNDNNQFKYLFNLATGSDSGNAAWAKAQLVSTLGRVYDDNMTFMNGQVAFMFPIEAAPAGGAGTKSISTPYGAAVQASSKEAAVVRQSINDGGDLYRAGTFGRSNTNDAQFWAPESPLNPGYAERYGVDFNQVDYVISGTINHNSPFITRPAPGLGNNAGGSIEVVTPANSVMLKWFHMP